jgi:thioredoxin-like negative regulator of GroEL
MLKHIEEEHFVPEVIATSRPVLLASLGDGNYQRKQMLLLAKLASVTGGRFKLLLMKADKEGLLMKKYGIKTAPAFLMFANGKVRGRHVGGFTFSQLKGFVLKALSTKVH